MERVKNTPMECSMQDGNELEIHSMIEEEIVYPETKDAVEEDLYLESYVEHDGAKVLINDFMANGPEDEFFEAKVTVLCEEISRHVEQEEKPNAWYFGHVGWCDSDPNARRYRL